MLELNPSVKRIKHVAEGFDQLVLFSISNEELNKQGRWTSYNIIRKVRIYYVGIIDSLHKYQLGCVESDFELINKSDSSADLLNKLHRVFTLLVIGADGHGTLKKIYNFPYLQQEWLELKNNILLEYDDTDIEKWSLISKMDLLMQDYSEVLKYLQLPSMYGLFFNGYWLDCLPDHPLKVLATYDPVMNDEVYEECIEYDMQETASQQLINITIKGSATRNDHQDLIYTGLCTFLDGALDQCHKKIDLGSIKLNYSVRWVGLKKIFQK